MKARFVCGAAAALVAFGAHGAQVQVRGGLVRGKPCRMEVRSISAFLMPLRR
jgi:hypothetical protein